MSHPRHFLQRLRQRKVVQYGLAYLAGGWLLLQVASLVGDHFAWSTGTLRAITVLLAAGFPIALVLAWYHGEKGRQRVSGPELLMLASLLVIAGVALTLVRDRPAESQAAGGSDITGDVARSALTGEDANSRPTPDVASIAVLPFDNLTGDPEQEYFSDGMTEEIITQLARLEGLKVISRTSAMRYKDAEKTLREIGEELGVGTVLEGSVRREGRQVKVTAQLIDATSDAHLGADTYDRELESIFEIQAEVARAIARELELRFSDEVESPAAATDRYGTDDREALDLYLRARAMWNLRTEEKIRQAIEAMERFLEETFGEDLAREVIPGVRAAYREGGADGYYRAMARATAEDAPHFLHALYVARAGDLDRAFELLEKSASNHEFQMIHIGAAPKVDRLGSDPRYRELLERMGLDEYLDGSPGPD